MTTQRRIARVEDVPALAPGFAGPGHTAAPVISMEEFARTDPFIALMDLHVDRVPVRREPGVDVRVYSGASGGVHAPTRNHVPVTIVEMTMKPGAAIEQDLPVTYNGFVFVVDGSVRVGEAATPIERNQLGWLDRPDGEGVSVVRLTAQEEGARLVLYAGQTQGTPIVAQGPFIGDTVDDIKRSYQEYRQGRFPRMSEIAAPARRQEVESQG